MAVSTIFFAKKSKQHTMKKQHIKILAFSFFLFTKGWAQSPGDIIITEFMPDPAKVADASGEWFEVYNTTDHAIDLNGWHISDLKTKKHTINATDPLIIKPGVFMVFAIKADSLINGGVVPDYTYTSFTFANASGKIALTDTGGVVIDSVNYTGTSSGKSWNLDPQHFKSTDNDVADNWCTASMAFGKGDMGTPGKMNTSCIATEIAVIPSKLTVSIHVMNGELNAIFSEVVEKQKWEIIDITGSVVQSGWTSETSGNLSIPLSKNERGMYFLRMYKGQYVLKFIL
jgi:hypothetical protein